MTTGITEMQELLVESGKKKAARSKRTFQDIEVEHSAKTATIVLPGNPDMSNREAIRALEKKEEQDLLEVSLNMEIDCFPLDGAVALAKVLKKTFGWTNLIPKKGFFGDTPPTMIEVETGPGETEQVGWGRMEIPGVVGYMETGIAWRGKRSIFCIQGVVQRRFEKLMHKLADKVREQIAEASIYRGKAIRISFRDEDGDPKDFNPGDCPRFINTDDVREEELIFPYATQALVDMCLFAPIQYTLSCGQLGVPLKRGALLEGPYGVGKTLLANILAKKCVQHGWTFIYIEDVRDLDKGLAMAEMYGNSVVFSEDLDRSVGLERDSEVDRILNTLDGVAQKGSQIMTVLTTNDVNNISQAMVRPGRIDTLVPIRAPDAYAAARLVLSYGRGLVKGKVSDGRRISKEEELIASSDLTLEQAIQPLLGNNAAVIRECVERSKLAAIWRLKGEVDDLVVTPADIAISALSMKEHIDLLKPRKVDDNSPMHQFGRAVGREVGKALSWKAPASPTIEA